MALRNVPYAAQTAPTMSELDQTFADVGALGVVPCTAAGTNLITLTPNANTPTISAYSNFLLFSFTAKNSSTGSVTLQVGSLAALPVFRADGTTQLGSGEIVVNDFYIVGFNSALNSGSGGWTVVSASATGVTVGTYNQPNITVDASGRITSATAGVSAFNGIGGMNLTWTSAAPSTTLTVLRGSCADFTNTTTITLTSGFSKSTGGAWTVGSGNNGLGTGLTYSSSTWYHVFPIINNSAADVYFDTSVTAANQPASTTAFRRVGSFLTNGASTVGQISITQFTQNTNEFLWANAIGDVAVTNLGTTATLFTLSVPLGVKVNALFNIVISNAGASSVLVNSPDAGIQATGTPSGNTTARVDTAGNATATPVNLRTNTSSQIRAVAGGANTTFQVATYGWIDPRGT